MTGLSHDEARLVLGLMLTPGIGNRTLYRALAAAGGRDEGLRILDDPDDATISGALGLADDLVRGFRSSVAEGDKVLEQLEERRVVVLAHGTHSYPDQLRWRLGTRCPPVLFAVGNLDVLERPGIGFCGSRQASDLGLAIASRYAAALGRRGCNIIAGYASGVDSASHAAALDAGGATTIVLAEGILRFRMKQELGGSSNPMNTLVLSEFPPGIPWIARNAMQRNQTICGLSSAMVVIESGLNGGTFEAGKFAQAAGCPLFVVNHGDPSESALGNSYFLNRGATPLSTDADGDPATDEIIEIVTSAEDWGASGGSGQSDLFARSNGD